MNRIMQRARRRTGTGPRRLGGVGQQRRQNQLMKPLEGSELDSAAAPIPALSCHECTPGLVDSVQSGCSGLPLLPNCSEAMPSWALRKSPSSKSLRSGEQGLWAETTMSISPSCRAVQSCSWRQEKGRGEGWRTVSCIIVCQLSEGIIILGRNS